MRENIPVIRLRHGYSDALTVRDGLVLCFFMRRSHGEVASAIWQALQAYRRAIPLESLNWYGSPDGDTLPLDDKGWEHIRWTVLERPWGLAWHVSLAETPGGGGGYHFDYSGLKLDDPMFSRDERATSAMALTLPTEYLLEQGPSRVRALALEIGRELPFSFGYASLAFISHPGAWARIGKELDGLLDRYLGFDLYLLSETSRNIGTRARGAYWLTFLGQPLLGQLGGVEALRQQLPFPEVSFQPLEGERLLLTLGEWPDAIDTQKGAEAPQYRALARLLKPFLYEEHLRPAPFTHEPG
jgi:hypothetical protein